jgi:6-phosphogluconolactonase
MEPGSETRALLLPASVAAEQSAVAVELKFQSSGSATFALVGGHLTPGGDGLVVTIRHPLGVPPNAPDLLQVVAGLEELPDRPAGRLELSWYTLHAVDSSPQAWRRAGAALGRLMMPDAASMSDELAALVAAEAGGREIDANPYILVAPSITKLAEDAADEIRAIAAASIAQRGRFRIALAGGSTPRAIYPRLVTGIDWTRTDVFFGDERAVPPDDAQSNYRMARETLLEPARVPPANVFRWRAEAADLDAAAREYEQALRARGAPPWLDLALLGLGPDGHTASLFPNTTALGVEDRLAVAVDVPAMATRRLTLTYPALISATHVMFLVTGAEKRGPLADVLRPASSLPAARIVHRAARVRILCDVDAARDINAGA